VSKAFAARKPAKLSFLEGAALANSAPRAMLAVESLSVKSADRVLVLGGSGGMGTCIVQLLKHKGVAFIAATSTDEKLLLSLGADQVINYQEQSWWEVPAFRAAPFDAIIDCAEGSIAWQRARCGGIVKSARQGGRFLAVVINQWDIKVTSWLEMIAWMGPFLWRLTWPRFVWGAPRYLVTMAEPTKDDLARLLTLAEDGHLKAVLDPACPLPFTEEGVRRAFSLHESRHAHGKVVVEVD
jgi:alcohol dehydrogenase